MNRIIKIIEDELDDLVYNIETPRMTDEYYLKMDAKIEVLEEILRLIDIDE